MRHFGKQNAWHAAALLAVATGAFSSLATAQQSEHDDHATHGHRHHRGVEGWQEVLDAPDRDAWQKPGEVVSLMALEHGMRVVDLGAGTGYFLPLLSPAVGADGEVLALDIDPELVAHIEERARHEGLGNVRARQVQPDDPGLEPALAERILVVDTWHHIDERVAYAGRLRQGLRPGGWVVVVDFTLDSPHGPPAEHRLTAEQVADELRSAGLDAEIVAESLPWQYVVVGRKK